MSIRMIAVDLDGTLLASDSVTVPEENIRALRRAAERGAEIVLASGRSLVMMEDAAEHLGCVDYAVSALGAVVTDRRTGRRLAEQTVEKLDVDFIPDLGALGAIRAGLAALGGLNVLAYPRHLQMEISRAGATKSWGIQALCANLGIEAREELALGDSDNDLDLLSWAGCSVAMANGSPLARREAGMVTAANDEGGVARAVEALMDRIGNG